MNDERATRRDVLGKALGLAGLLAFDVRGNADPSPRRRRQYVDTRFGQIHVTTAEPANGAARHPALVCFHPSPTTGDMYRDLQQVLATDRVVHCPDTPGYGASDPPAAKPTMQDYGAALAAAVDALVLRAGRSRAPVDLFGFHTGSLCALEVALQRPDLVRRVVLSGVPHYSAEERERKRRVNVPGYPYFDDPDYVAKLYKRLVLDARESGTPEQRLTRFGDRLRAGPNGWWGPDAVFTYDSVESLPQLRKPTLLIAFNEEMTQPTRDAAQLIPGAQLIEMLDLPIFGFIVAPARIAAAIRVFLDAPLRRP